MKTNIDQAEHSFNRKLMKVRVQRKQVVFKTVVAFFAYWRLEQSACHAAFASRLPQWIFAVAENFVFTGEPCGSEPARDSVGTVTAFPTSNTYQFC